MQEHLGGGEKFVIYLFGIGIIPMCAFEFVNSVGILVIVVYSRLIIHTHIPDIILSVILCYL